MRIPERRRPKVAGFDTFLPLLAVPVAITGFIVLAGEVVSRLGVQGGTPSRSWGSADPRNVPGTDSWMILLGAVDVVTAAWLTWHFHRQRDTYVPIRFEGGWGARAFQGVLWLLAKGLFFAMMGFLALFLVLPVMIGLVGAGVLLAQREPTFLQRLVSDAAFLLGLSTAVVGLTAFSRAFWLWSALRHVELLPTAPEASPPEGLVEVRGVASPRDGVPRDRAVLSGACVGPFFLETGGRRILVEPPEGFDPAGGQALLPDDGTGGRVLRAGDPVIAVGRLDRDSAGADGPVLRPCPSPRGSLIFTGRKRFFSIPHLFLIAHGDEAQAKRRLARTHLLWIGIASFLTVGGAIVALLGLAARLDPLLLGTLAVGGGAR